MWFRSVPSYARLLTRLLHEAKHSLVQSEGLIQLADSLYARREFELLESVGKMLLQIQSKPRGGAGEYYLALAAKNKGFTKESLLFLEITATSVDPRFRARAFSTLGAILREQNRLDESLRLRLQAFRVAISNDYCEPLIMVEAQRAIAILKSINGDHEGALGTLEAILPFAKIIQREYPGLYYDVLNSFAVELGEVGRVDEAFGAVNISLASPFAAAYPEWLATRAELIERERGRRASRSFVAVDRILEGANVLPFALMLAKAKEGVRQARDGLGSLQRIDNWKMNTKQPKKEPELSRKEKQSEIINAVLDCDDKELDALREFLKKKHPDSEDASES
jgi:tetratricopeptide (TPR) repeat protein